MLRKKIDKQVIIRDLKIIFRETRVFIITNVLVSLGFIALLFLIDVEYIENQIRNTTLVSLEFSISVIFIVVQFIIFLAMVLYKYSLSRKTTESLLKEDESNSLEFKSSLRWDYKLNKVNKDLEHSMLKTIAGFSNADGGTLLIGISDDKKILGLDKDYATLKRKDKDGFMQYVTKKLTHALGNNIMRNISIYITTLAGKDVCRIDVLPAKDPVFLSFNGKDEFFIRTANITIPLTIKESYIYLQRRK